MTLALLCQFTAQHVSDVNTSIFRMCYCVGCIVLTWGVLVLCSGIGCWWCGIRVQAEPLLLQMDVLTSETCWAVNWHNKAIVIKLVYLYSNIKMMHGPIRISIKLLHLLAPSSESLLEQRNKVQDDNPRHDTFARFICSRSLRTTKTETDVCLHTAYRIKTTASLCLNRLLSITFNLLNTELNPICWHY